MDGFHGLDVDWKRLKLITQRYNEKSFPSPEQCGNISNIKNRAYEDMGSSPKEHKQATLFYEIHNEDIITDGRGKSFFIKQDQDIANTITEIVDLEAIKMYANSISSTTQNSWFIKNKQNHLWGYINYVEENGIDYNGLKKHDVKYFRVNGIGRRFAIGPSMQNMAREVRKVAFQNNSFDIDMVNAWPSILSMELRKENVFHMYPAISMYDSYPLIWKTVMSEYYDETIEESKIRMIQPLYGSLPSDDNPYLWKLTSEVISAAKFLLSLKKYKKINNMFQGRKIKIFSKLLTLIVASEDNLLTTLETFLLQKFPTANISLLQFDGLQLFLDPKRKKDVEKAIEEYEKETGISVVIKQLEPNPMKPRK